MDTPDAGRGTPTELASQFADRLNGSQEWVFRSCCGHQPNYGRAGLPAGTWLFTAELRNGAKLPGTHAASMSCARPGGPRDRASLLHPRLGTAVRCNRRERHTASTTLTRNLTRRASHRSSATWNSELCRAPRTPDIAPRWRNSRQRRDSALRLA